MKIKTIIIACLSILILGCQARLDLQDQAQLAGMEAFIAESQKNNALQFEMVQSKITSLQTQIDLQRDQVRTNFYICIALFITLFLCLFALLILLYQEKKNQNRFLQSLILKNNNAEEKLIL